MSLFATELVKADTRRRGRVEQGCDPAYEWPLTQGPWLDNNLAVCEFSGGQLGFSWFTGEVVDAPRRSNRGRLEWG